MTLGASIFFGGVDKNETAKRGVESEDAIGW
jgi:hypothetical protein